MTSVVAVTVCKAVLAAVGELLAVSMVAHRVAVTAAAAVLAAALEIVKEFVAVVWFLPG